MLLSIACSTPPSFMGFCFSLIFCHYFGVSVVCFFLHWCEWCEQCVSCAFWNCAAGEASFSHVLRCWFCCSLFFCFVFVSLKLCRWWWFPGGLGNLGSPDGFLFLGIRVVILFSWWWIGGGRGFWWGFFLAGWRLCSSFGRLCLVWFLAWGELLCSGLTFLWCVIWLRDGFCCI